LRAGERDAEKGRGGGAHTIHHGLDAKLFRVDAAFLIDSIRSGASNTIGLGQNDLTNYVLAVTNILDQVAV